MAILRSSRRRPWLPWVRAGLVLALVGAAAWGALELGQRFFGLQRLTIEQVVVHGTRGERLAQVQALAESACLGKPLFLFDAEGLRARIGGLRWVKGLVIRKDPPERLVLVVEERRPILWLVRPKGVYLVSEDGTVMDRVTAGNLAPIPVVSDPASQEDRAFLGVLRAARALKERQRDFFDRVTELRWSGTGPVAFLEGLDAPLLLSRVDPARNVPNFQALYLSRFAGDPKAAQPRYFDLRWEVEGGYVAVGDQPLDRPPASRPQ